VKTDDLIDMLASGPDVRMNAPRTGPDLLRLLAGLGASVLLMLATLGMRAHLWQAFATPAFWIKFVFALALAAGAGLAARRLAVPGASLRHAPLFVGLPLLAIWLLAAIVLWQAAPDERAALLWGRTWRVCAPLIAMISLPVFGAALPCAHPATAGRRRRRAGGGCGGCRRLLPALPRDESCVRRRLVRAGDVGAGGDRGAGGAEGAGLVNGRRAVSQRPRAALRAAFHFRNSPSGMSACLRQARGAVARAWFSTATSESVSCPSTAAAKR